MSLKGRLIRHNSQLERAAMSFFDQIESVAARVERHRDRVRGNSAAQTKQVLVAPVLRALGYDVHDPDDVIPAFAADQASQPIDYALCPNDTPAVLLQCFAVAAALPEQAPDRLRRAIRATPAQVGAVTDGETYRLFAVGNGGLASTPFTELRLPDLDRADVSVLQFLRTDAFDADALRRAARRERHRVKPRTSPASAPARHVAYHMAQVYRISARHAEGQKKDRLRAFVERVAGALGTADPETPLAETISDTTDDSSLLQLVDAMIGIEPSASTDTSTEAPQADGAAPADADWDELLEQRLQAVELAGDDAASEEAEGADALAASIEDRLEDEG